MSKSTAERQATYRSKIAGTHKRVEIILDEAAYTKLQTLVEKSDYRTRIDYISALIKKEHQSLSGNISLQDNETSLAPANDKNKLPGNDQKKTVSRKRPAKKKPKKTIEIWQGEKQCQSQTARGTRCRIGHHLSVIPHKRDKKTYEVLACKQHIEHFTLHESLLK